MRTVGVLGVLVLSATIWPGAAGAQGTGIAAAAQALVHDASGRLITKATFRESAGGVLINLVFQDPAVLTGNHAIQIHDTGRCDGSDFSTAGGIFNPFGKRHGLLNPDGPMAGDLPNLMLGAAGLPGYNTEAPLATLAPGPASLLRQLGTSLVIFAQTDDNQSQPEGNAGARFACGVILATPNQPSSAPGFGQTDTLATLMIGAMGALLIAAGIVLRRR